MGLVYGRLLNQVERHIYLEKNAQPNDQVMEQVCTIKDVQWNQFCLKTKRTALAS